MDLTFDNDELVKQRDIIFLAPQRERDPAAAAITLLTGVDGIFDLYRNNEYALHVSYNIAQITLCDIEDALQEVGFHLDNSVITKLKRALLYYAEDTQLANLGYDHSQSKSTLEIFINRYNQMRHGCRDERPEHYRHYS